MIDNALPRKSDQCGEAGFTLVELLVALALFSLLATLLFGNVRFGLKAWQIGSAHAERVDSSMTAQNLLRRVISNAYPLFLLDGAGHSRVDFDGARDAVSFLGSAPMVVHGGGRFRFKVLVERQQDRSELVMTATPELADPQDRSMTTKTLLLADVDRAEFSYFGAAAAEPAGQWHDSWTQLNELPKLVRLRVTFRSGDARLWPDLVVAPRILADVGCAYDPITTRCRGR